jgi:hypothetical protein
VSDGPRIRVIWPDERGPSTLSCDRCLWTYEIPEHVYVWEVWEVAVGHWDTKHMGVFASEERK